MSNVTLKGPARRPPRVPFVIVILMLLALIAAGVMLVLGASAVGVTWDERIHAVMLEEYFNSGWYASPDWLVNGAPDAFLGKWPYYVYAPVASLIGHFFTVIGGAEPWGGFSDSSSAYALRHFASGLVAVIGIIGTGLIARLLTNSWRWALVGAAFIATTPMWIGHGMFNVKDLPVGTGYTLVTLGFVAICRRNYSESKRQEILVILSMIVGIVLAVGARPASGLPMSLTGALIVFVCALTLIIRRRSPEAFPHLGRRIRDIAIGFVAAYLTLLAIYPKGFINPFTLAKESLLISGRFPVGDAVLVNGSWLPQPPPWYYLPTWFGAQLTIIVIVLLLVFLVMWGIQAVKLITAGKGARTGAFESWLLPVPVVLQAFLFPALALLVHSTMYNAVRQFLFVVPAVCVLAAVGLWRVMAHFTGEGRRDRVTRTAVWVLVAIGLIAPTVDQIRLFPYNYVYFNEVTTLQPINGRWATDYWRASSMELTRIIPGDGPVSCRFITAKQAMSPCADDATIQPFWSTRGSNAKPGSLGAGEYWYVRENGGGVSVPAGCTLHDQVTRPLRGQDLIIAEVLKCSGP
jgi:hypothetical protein